MPTCAECGVDVPAGIVPKGERRLCGPCRRGGATTAAKAAPRVSPGFGITASTDSVDLRERIAALEAEVESLRARLAAKGEPALDRKAYMREYMRKRRAQAAG